MSLGKDALWSLILLLLAGSIVTSQEIKPGGTRTVLPPEPRVGAYYFYWYRHPQEHMTNPDGSDGLFQHFRNPETVSYLEPDWHRSQVESMMEAGLDFFLPVYWGIPDRLVNGKQRLPFSDAGLDAMVKALSNVEKDGGTPPRVGLFYDTSTLRRDVRGEDGPGGVDLRTKKGRDVFSDTIVGFFQRIPRKFRFTMEDYVLVVLYGSFGLPHDRDLLEKVGDAVTPRIGNKVFFVAEESWNARSHARYRWGSALHGPGGDSIVQTLGPGYNDTPVPGRGTPIRDRENGRFYEWSWNQVLLRRPTLVFIETWNEFHEGSGIAPSVEYGDTFLTLTRRAVRRLKQNILPDINKPVRLAHPEPLIRPDKGWWKGTQDSTDVSFAASRARGDIGNGLRVITSSDGPFKRQFLPSSSVLSSSGPNRGVTYLYFGVADEFANNTAAGYEIEVEILDGEGGPVHLQYDSWDISAALSGRYKDAPSHRRGGVLKKTTLTWSLPDARLGNRQNGGADFRLVARDGNLSLTRITLRRLRDKPGGAPTLKTR